MQLFDFYNYMKRELQIEVILFFFVNKMKYIKLSDIEILTLY